VINPAGADGIWKGDCFEMFLDLRPVRGSGDLLGAPGYTPGVWQLLVMPPTDDGKAFAWQRGSTGGGSPGPIEVVARRASGGYEVEMRLPVASLLPQAPAGRPEEPFGFDVQIDDLDAPGTPEATAQCMGYSWSHALGYSQDASLFACTSRHLGREPDSSVLRFEPAVLTQEGGRWAAQAVVAGVAGQQASVELGMRWRHEASSYDRASAPPGVGVLTVPKAQLDPATARDDYPWLGVWFCRRALRFERPAPGRYTLTTRCQGDVKLRGRARLYFSTGGGGLQPVTGPPSEQDALNAVDQLDLDTYYPAAREALPGTIRMSPPPALSFALSEEAHRAEAAGRAWTSP